MPCLNMPALCGAWQVLQEKGVEFVVAPYEADAQMAYLCRTLAVDAVITEDSDLIAYGCPRVRPRLPAAFTKVFWCPCHS